MNKLLRVILYLSIFTTGFLSACSASIEKPAQGDAASSQPAGQAGIKVMATQSFLADIAQNVAGDRFTVDTLIPPGTDPHNFEATPQDIARLYDTQVLIENGAGLEEWLQEMLQNSGGQHQVIVASAGLEPGSTNDPHFWLDPLKVVKYVENIRDGLASADPAGSQTYRDNASAYIDQLTELDQWIQTTVAEIPPEQRLLVTNHESFGYFADRYGFKIIGTIIPATSSGASPSAQDLARLVDTIRNSGAKAIFLETGTNPQLAEQISQETGVKVVSDLYSHTLTTPDDPAPDYISMMRYNVETIVDALR